MSMKYDNGSTLQSKLLEGIDVLANNVASTLGPKGRNVILQQKGSPPIVTKDGVTVAKFVNLEDPHQNVAVQILKQASEQTNNNAGDGTTTATVLARAIYKNALKYIIAGASPTEIKKGIDLAVDNIVDALQVQSRPIMSKEDIEHIATISANGDAIIGELIATAVDAAGKDGSITIQEARSLETSLDVVEGFRFDSGYVSPQFVTDERRGVVKYDDPVIVVTDEKIETVDEMLPMLEIAARESRPFIIVAENIEGQALAALIMNAVRGTMKVAAVKAPRYGEERRSILKDLAISTGATFLSRESGKSLKNVSITDFGTAKSIEIEKGFTTIIDAAGDDEEVENRIDALKVEMEQTDPKDVGELQRIQERITRLASGVAVINVGAPTEIEMIEKKHRVEDALEAVKSARDEGIVPGGGIALIRAQDALDSLEGDNEDQDFGIDAIAAAIKEPLRQMAMNAGESPDIIVSSVEDVTEYSVGFDFSTGEMVDMYEKGIIDPAKVTRSALQNAASVASTLLTTNYAIIEN